MRRNLIKKHTFRRAIIIYLSFKGIPSPTGIATLKEKEEILDRIMYFQENIANKVKSSIVTSTVKSMLENIDFVYDENIIRIMFGLIITSFSEIILVISQGKQLQVLVSKIALLNEIPPIYEKLFIDTSSKQAINVKVICYDE
jgi:hypothetical protein